MWFKMSADLKKQTIWRMLKDPSKKRDPRGTTRLYCFIMLLTETAEGRAEDLQDARDLARIVDTTERQAEIVWAQCIKFDVLRPTAHGYSARAWMIENGILGDARPNAKPSTTYATHKGATTYAEKSKNLF